MGGPINFWELEEPRIKTQVKTLKLPPPTTLNCCSDFMKHVTVSISLVENQVLDLIV